ncbi:MAG: hypothetical protein U0441_24935 [Polyangiaceae bacterium]
MGELTEHAIQKVVDVEARARLETAYELCTGIAAVCLSDKSDDKTQLLKKQLAGVEITLETVENIVAASVRLMAEIADRDSKADAYHIAVAHAKDTEASLGQQIASSTLLLRGKLGSKNPDLESFGVKIRIGGRPTKPRSTKKPTDSAPAAAPVPASPVK